MGFELDAADVFNGSLNSCNSRFDLLGRRVRLLQLGVKAGELGFQTSLFLLVLNGALAALAEVNQLKLKKI